MNLNVLEWHLKMWRGEHKHQQIYKYPKLMLKLLSITTLFFYFWMCYMWLRFVHIYINKWELSGSLIQIKSLALASMFSLNYNVPWVSSSLYILKELLHFTYGSIKVSSREDDPSKTCNQNVVHTLHLLSMVHSSPFFTHCMIPRVDHFTFS